MKFIDILEDAIIDKSIENKHDKRYCTLMINRKEYAMLRWALKTKDAIENVLDEELEISHKQRKNITK